MAAEAITTDIIGCCEQRILDVFPMKDAGRFTGYESCCQSPEQDFDSTHDSVSMQDLICLQPEQGEDSTQDGREIPSVHPTRNVDSTNLTQQDITALLKTVNDTECSGERSRKPQDESSLTLKEEQANNLLLGVRDLRIDIRDELRQFRCEFREMRDCVQLCMKKMNSLEEQIARIADMVCQRNTESVTGNIQQAGSSQKMKFYRTEQASASVERNSQRAVVTRTDSVKSKSPDAASDFEGFVKQMPVNAVLQDIHKHFIAIKDNDFKHYFKVFDGVFNEVLKVMRTQDNYFSRYSSKIQYAGSHYDNLKVGKPNEFDMDVVIRLPISKKFNSEDVKLEGAHPGFVMLKMGEQFLNLRMKPDWESHHKITDDWCDKQNFLLQSSLRKWIEATVQKALNTFERNEYGESVIKVDDVAYTIRIHKSGPAFTMHLQNRADKKFKLDVDLVPVIEFELPRWPVGHRPPSETAKKKGWFVVPKPMKTIENEDLRNRHWRLAFQDQEREVMEGLYNMKPTIRLLKKLRDSLKLTGLASYYIKTLFLWESESTRENKEFWKNNFAFLFQHMVTKLHEALVNKSIPYYWNKKFNLIQCLEGKIKGYEEKVKAVLDAFEERDNLKLAKSLLTKEEFEEFKVIKS